MRRMIEFACAGEMLVGTLDEGDGAIGLLIVSGGNELRAGAHRGMASLSARLAAQGISVFRYDRRGIGDSSGRNEGYAGSREEIAVAATRLRRDAGVSRVVAFGNCDAASALALFHGDAAIDGLVLANPWTGGSDDSLPQAAAIRARYAERLRDPREWLRLLRGGVDLRKLLRGLAKVVRPAPESTEQSLIDRMAAALGASRIPTTILLAARDNTAVAFADAWARSPWRTDAAIVTRASASHSFAEPGDQAWLIDRLVEAIGDA